MDKEILAATKAEVSPTKPATKLNLVNEEDRVAPLEYSSTNQSTTSTSSTDTVLTARESSHTDNIVKDSKSPLCSNTSSNQNNSSNETGVIKTKEKKTESPKALVFKLDTESGEFVTSGDLVPDQLESANKDSSDQNDKVTESLEKGESLQDNDAGVETSKRKSSEHKPKSSLSDNLVVSEENSDVSDGESESNLNTTDDLIAASMGLIKLEPGGEGSTSIISDQLDVSDRGSINEVSGGNNSSSSVLKDASRLYDISDKVKESPGGYSSSEYIQVDNSSCGAEKLQNSRSEQVQIHINKSDSVSTDKSSDFENDIREEEVSHILRTSLNQFLSSRLSRSRNFEDSRNLSSINNSDLKLNGSNMESYYPLNIHTPVTNEQSSLNGLDSYCNYSSPSLKSFEKHEKGVRYLAKSRNGSKSSDYSSQESMIFPEGSFSGQCKHRDGSNLGK